MTTASHLPYFNFSTNSSDDLSAKIVLIKLLAMSIPNPYKYQCWW